MNVEQRSKEAPVSHEFLLLHEELEQRPIISEDSRPEIFEERPTFSLDFPLFTVISDRTLIGIGL